jgi:hypothetical protein
MAIPSVCMVTKAPVCFGFRSPAVAAAFIFRIGKQWIPDNRMLKRASPQTMVSKNDETILPLINGN